MAHVHVIGAGVLGLTTAVLLASSGYKVTLIAKHFPGDEATIEYTSPWAGAKWESVAKEGDLRQQRYEAESFKMFWKLALQVSHTQCGVMAVPAYNYYKSPSPSQLDPWFKHIVPSFLQLGKDELPEGFDMGYHYMTVVIHPAIYLKWLLSQFLTLSGTCKRQTLDGVLDTVKDQDDAAIVVNCSGIHARTLGDVMDTTIIPTRGQNVILRAPHIRKSVSIHGQGVHNYVIPRSDGTVVVGTTDQEFSFDTDIDQKAVQKVLAQASAFCPEIKAMEKPDIVGYVAGVRPIRQKGPRVEIQEKYLQSGKPVWVIHNYGHGGFGYIASWGSSLHALELVRQVEETLEKEKTTIRALFTSRL